MSEDAPGYIQLNKATLETLPFEILDLISSSLDRLDERSLVSLSRTSNTLRACDIPKLFKEVILDEDTAVAKEDRRFREGSELKECVRALIGNNELCQSIQDLIISLSLAWKDLRDFSNLSRLLVQSNIRFLHIDYPFMPEKDPFDPENEAHAGYEKLWKTISKLPHLESLYHWKPMDFKLNLRDFPALKTLTFHYGQLRENIGGLPSLEHLSLLYFHRIDSSWLHPRLVRTLKSLRLKKPGAGDLRAIASSFKHFSSVLKTPSSIQSLSFELHPFAESSTYSRILEDFMKSLSPVSFPNLRYLAAHSIYDDIFGTSCVGFLDDFL